MKPIKVMTIFGTRPEAIKMAPVVLELQRHPGKIQSIVAVTASIARCLIKCCSFFISGRITT